MKLATLLEQNRETILGKWFDLIAETYPRATSEFLAKQADRFRNPVGHAISQGIGPIYDQVVSAMNRDELLNALDGIIRIRAVQEFSPSEAVAFVFQLKAAIRDVMDEQLQGSAKWGDLEDLESRIDRVALLAFEKYTECREKLHEIRNKQFESGTTRLREKASVKSAVPPHKEESIDDFV
jgi:hypothetical protein